MRGHRERAELGMPSQVRAKTRPFKMGFIRSEDPSPRELTFIMLAWPPLLTPGSYLSSVLLRGASVVGSTPGICQGIVLGGWVGG